MYIMIQFTFRSLIFENCLYLLFAARELWIGISLPVEICREDGVWPGELFGGGSFNGVCSIDICQGYEATIPYFRCLKGTLGEGTLVVS